MNVPHYLQRSPKTGAYSFRIAVPVSLRPVIRKREIKQSLKTKDQREALAKALPLYAEAMRLFEAARGVQASKPEQPRQAYDAAVRWAEGQGFDPFQRPDPNVDEDDFLARSALADQFQERVQKGGATAVELMKLKSLTGTLTAPEPTISEMVTLYLAERNGPQDRSEAEQKAFEQMVRRYESYLLRSLRKDKVVAKVNRADARGFRDWLANDRPDAKPLKPASINKALRIVRAIFAHAIREWELDMANPFAGLRVEERESAKDLRRSFTDAELASYLAAAIHMNDQAHHCTVLMAYTGARTGEIVGLECNDIRIGDGVDVPHILIRPNETRPMLKTPNSKRAIPLVGPAIQAATEALSSFKVGDANAPLFPRYAKARGKDALSALQNKLIRTRLRILDPALVAYSTRHTLKDRLRNALVQPDLQDAILGHNRGQASEGYGSGYWLPRLKEALIKAHAVNEGTSTQ